MVFKNVGRDKKFTWIWIFHDAIFIFKEYFYLCLSFCDGEIKVGQFHVTEKLITNDGWIKFDIHLEYFLSQLILLPFLN